MKTLEQMVVELDSNIPRDVISKRDAGNGRKLDYLEAWYVIDRMNQIFGHLSWDRETVELKQLPGEKPAYMAKVRVTVNLTNSEGRYHTCSIKEGHGFGNAKGGSQDHELAIKEAESDAFKRAAMQFGRSMGLALYDKTQEYVEDVKKGSINESKGFTSGNLVTTRANIYEQSSGTDQNINSMAHPKDDSQSSSRAISNPEKKGGGTNDGAQKDLIRAKFKTLLAANKVTKESFIDKYLKPFSVNSVIELADGDVSKCLELIKGEYA